MRPTKNSLTICIGTLAALLLAGCSQDGLPGDGASSVQDAAALHITAATLQLSQAQSLSRASASDALAAGSIGVFRSQGTGYSETQANRQYTFVSGGWQPQADDQIIYLMANEAQVCAYYPYNAAYTNKTAIPLASGKYEGTVDDPTKHDPADLCYATDRAMDGSKPSTRFEMNHAMAMVQIRFRRTDVGSTACTLTSVSIKNPELISIATLDITGGTYTTGGKAALQWTPGTTDSATGIPLPASATSEATSALLVPCTLDAAGTTFSFIVDGKLMTVEVSAAKLPAFEAGKIHRLMFGIKTSSVSLEQVSIIDWWREWDESNEPDADGSLKDYIKLGGVKWALSNLEHNAAYHNYNFAAFATAEGTKLKWNALTVADGGNPAGTWDAVSDPCSRLEPKDTWVSPTKEDFAALTALPSVWVTGYEGVNGRWFGTADAAEAALNSGHHLFLPAASATTAAYWTKSYNTATKKPVAFSISSGASPAVADTEYTTCCPVRCVKK